MAEKSKTENQNNQNPLPPLMIHTQYIKDLSVEIPHAPEIFKDMKQQPSVKVDVDINARHLEENVFDVSLNFRIDGDIEQQKFFIVEMTYAGVVSLNVPEEHLEAFLMIEAPHMLFPYARQAISNVMGNAGLNPIMLNPLDFAAMYKARLAARQQQKPANEQ